MKKVKYGIVGTGAIARYRHLKEGAVNKHVEIAAICDLNFERAQETASEFGGVAYSDWKVMLKEADIDAVVICTPNVYHAPIAMASAKAGKHVLVEKPMCVTKAEGKKMIAAAKKAGKYLMVGQNQRLMPPHVKAKEILDSGRVGKVLSFRSEFQHPGPGSWSADGERTWFYKKSEAAMGALGDLGVHKADLMRWLLGEEFDEVSAIVSTLDKKIDLDDHAVISLKSKKGVVGQIVASWVNYGPENNQTVLYCSKGTIEIGVHKDYPVVVTYKGGKGRELHEVGAIASNTVQVSSGVIDLFTECILKKKAPEINGEEGLASVNVILTAMEAADQGKVMKIKK